MDVSICGDVHVYGHTLCAHRSSELQVPMLLIELLDGIVFGLVDVGYLLAERLFEHHRNASLPVQLLLVRDELSNEAGVWADLGPAECCQAENVTR